MFTADRKYIIHWELTDICNLKCPMCPRTDISNYCRPVKGIRKTQFYLKDVQQYLPDTFLHGVAGVDFCGNFGDPCMARDYYEICTYLIKTYEIKIMVSTNGSMRNPAWWKKLGELFCGTKSRIEFHIDGLEDTNHRYRIGASWHKLMANTRAFISTGARADWIFILFKHNQHQIEAAHKIARNMGFHSFVLVDSGRFPEGGKYRYMHPNGQPAELEKATISIFPGIEAKKFNILEVKSEANEKIGSNPTIPSDAVGAVPPSGQDSGQLKAVNGITCKASKHNRFYIDAQGNVAPCCWVSGTDPQNPGNMLMALKIAGKSLEDFNLRNRPLEKILNDELFACLFAELWEKDALSTCRKKCGKKHRNIRSTMNI
jgi:MoaA/NifB/PqqE/SkfB family radical SAM enzyme